jgi:antitoxin component YwqK of YwqJK toxin-antitoxin module
VTFDIWFDLSGRFKGDNMQRVPNDSLDYQDGLMYLDGKPFTGIGYYLDDDEGWVEGEIGYVDGLESGYKREWSGPDQLIYEGRIYAGSLHGKERRWHDDGQLAEEGDYEFGVAIREKHWDEDGNLTKEFELKDSDPAYQRLQEYRRLYGDVPTEDPT